jgi:hypothetical protein
LELALTKDNDLESLLQQDSEGDEWSRIKELAQDPQVMEIYQREFANRKDNLDLLSRGQKTLPKLLRVQSVINQAKQKILQMRIGAFKKHIQLTPAQVAYIHQVQEGIQIKEQELAQLLQSRELATAYR